MCNNKENEIKQNLVSEGYQGLFEALQYLKSLTLGTRYRIGNLFAIGGQGILWTASDRTNPDRAILIRMAMLPYHRPAYISEKEIQQARQHMENEAYLLRLFNGEYFPQLYDVVYASNPLFPLEFGAEIIENEPYLVIERIEGTTLAQDIKSSYRHSQPWEAQVAWSLFIAQTLLRFFKCLVNTTTGWLYSDLNPKNLIFPKQGDVILRVLDVGSVIPIEPQSDVAIPFSWEYIPPEYCEAYEKGVWRWPTQQFVLYTLGKMLWQILAHRHPLPKENPDLTLLNHVPYPQDLQRFIAMLIHQEFDSFEDAFVALRQVKSIGLIKT